MPPFVFAILRSLGAVNATPVGEAERVPLARLIAYVACRKVGLHARLHWSTLEHLQAFTRIGDAGQDEEGIGISQVMVDRVPPWQHTRITDRVNIVVSSSRTQC